MDYNYPYFRFLVQAHVELVNEMKNSEYYRFYTCSHQINITIFMVANMTPWPPYKTNLLILFNCRNYSNNSKQIMKSWDFLHKKIKCKVMYKQDSLFLTSCANKRFIVLPNTEQGTCAG
jgi:hypothetical protein